MRYIMLKPGEYSPIEDSLRFAVGDAEGAYSDRWTVEIGRDGSFYVTSKGLSRAMKLSIHPNVALWGFTDQAHRRYQSNRKLLNVERSTDRFCFDEPEGRLKLVASICFPSAGLRRTKTPWPKRKPSLYFAPAPKNKAQVVCFSVGFGLEFPAAISGLPENFTIMGVLIHKEKRRSLYIWRHSIDFHLQKFVNANQELFGTTVAGQKLDDVIPKKGDNLAVIVGCKRAATEPIRLIEIGGFVVQ